ncbi:MAG: NUDIX hydrolase [Caulobacterales bacterium]|nr:NUDIX hydrolase [Caulobacterales bacterium]
MSDQPPAFTLKVPPGEDRERRVCDRCGHVDYLNPKIVVGSVAAQGDKILLCRRAIDPRHGYWTLPAGYLEQAESTDEGALREAREEAHAELEIDALLGMYSLPRISQIQLIFRARLVSGVAPGPESLEVGLFAWDEIPWKDLAFPTVRWALEDWRATRHAGAFAPFRRTAPMTPPPE